MVSRRQARWCPGKRGLRLAHHYELPADPGGRTRTSRGGVLAAIGRSQCYTIADTGKIDGFKFIAPEDRHVFQAAALGIDV